MYLITAYFDDHSNKILKRYMDRIADKTGNHFMTEHQVPPHMTISSIEARDAQVLVPAFESLEGKVREGEIIFASIGQLLPYVFYAAPVLNQYLQELQELVYGSVKDIPETAVSKMYRPYSWLPHVTLGKTLDKVQMQQAFAVMQEEFSPFQATVTKLGLSQVNPHTDVRIMQMRH